MINDHFTNVATLLAAFQRTLQYQPAPFDRYAHALANGDQHATTLISESAQRGLSLFLSARTQCLNCHTGPTFRNNQFHNIGTAPAHRAAADPWSQAASHVC